MKKITPLVKVIPHLRKATALSLGRLSEKTIAKKTEANNFLTDVADAILFVGQVIKETFTTGF